MSDQEERPVLYWTAVGIGVVAAPPDDDLDQDPVEAAARIAYDMQRTDDTGWDDLDDAARQMWRATFLAAAAAWAEAQGRRIGASDEERHEVRAGLAATTRDTLLYHATGGDTGRVAVPDDTALITARTTGRPAGARTGPPDIPDTLPRIRTVAVMGEDGNYNPEFLAALRGR